MVTKARACHTWTATTAAATPTTVAAMIPLWNAGAGLIRGFALTTIVGVTIGVFITRPAFAAMIEKLLK